MKIGITQQKQYTLGRVTGQRIQTIKIFDFRPILYKMVSGCGHTSHTVQYKISEWGHTEIVQNGDTCHTTQTLLNGERDRTAQSLQKGYKTQAVSKGDNNMNNTAQTV